MRSRLAQEIRSARKAAGLTQVQLGMRLGLKGRAVYRWERDASSPTKRHQRALVLAIQAVNPQAASALAAFIASTGKGALPVSAVPLAAEPVIDVAAVAEGAVYQLADELNVPARQVRGALARLFSRLRQANLTLESAGQQLERQIAEKGEQGWP